MATVRAYIRTTKKGNVSCNVRFRLSDGRGVYFFSKSNLYVFSNDWDSKNEKIKSKILFDGKKRTDFDNAILEHKQYIIDNYNSHKGNLEANWLEVLLDKKYNPSKYRDINNDTFLSLFYEFIYKHQVSELRKRHYFVVFRELQRFEKVSGKVLDIHKFNNDNLYDFKTFLKNEHIENVKRPDIYGEIKKGKLPKKRADNTIIGAMKKIRTFYRWLHNMGKTTNDPFNNFEIGTAKYGTPIFITKTERDLIANFDLSSRPQLAIQRDIFIFQCLVGCRVGDLIRFTKEYIHEGILSYIPNKTAENEPATVEVPLSDNALLLIGKYQNTASKKLFPFISNQKYNNAIREIFKLAGITRLVTWFNPQTKQDEKKPINEIASSHLARRTFIGNLYSKVQDPNLIGAMSGHVEGSKAFNRYRDIDLEIKREVVKNYMD